jgi:hypothetical protein
MGRLVLVSLAAILLTPGAAAAQFMLGAQGNWGDSSDFGVGARVAYGMPVSSQRIELVGMFDWFFPQSESEGIDVTYWEINANVNYVIPVRSQQVATYVGAGLNVAYAKVDVGDSIGSASNTEYGLNILGGIRGTGKIAPFGEVRFDIAGGEQFVFTAGVSFLLGS